MPAEPLVNPGNATALTMRDYYNYLNYTDPDDPRLPEAIPDPGNDVPVAGEVTQEQIRQLQEALAGWFPVPPVEPAPPVVQWAEAVGGDFPLPSVANGWEVALSYTGRAAGQMEEWVGTPARRDGRIENVQINRQEYTITYIPHNTPAAMMKKASVYLNRITRDKVDSLFAGDIEYDKVLFYKKDCGISSITVREAVDQRKKICQWMGKTELANCDMSLLKDFVDTVGGVYLEKEESCPPF